MCHIQPEVFVPGEEPTSDYMQIEKGRDSLLSTFIYVMTLIKQVPGFSSFASSFHDFKIVYSHFTNISVCGVGGKGCGSSFKRELHAHIYLD